jgi:hypothetical protein
MVTGYLENAQPVELPGRPLALIVPHAGYGYSGSTAAHAYSAVRGGNYSRVVLMGPLHRPIWGSQLGPFMVARASGYATPLGHVPLDQDFMAELGRTVPLTSVRGDEEHSLEIQLPFLQVALAQSFLLVPIMFGERITDPGAGRRLEELAASLAALAGRDETTLLVASTDLSHLDNYADVVRFDHQTVDLVNAFDVPGLVAALSDGRVHACGATGLIAALRAAQLLHARGARVLAYAASGDITGDRRPGTYTVGYLAAAVYA